jgi:hypothetical protein
MGESLSFYRTQCKNKDADTSFWDRQSIGRWRLYVNKNEAARYWK